MPDRFTGLLNRREIHLCLAAVLAEPPVHGTWTAALLCDLDDFRKLNDRYGYEIGDEALRTLCDRMYEAVRDNDLVSRIGGDQFLIVLEKVTGEDEALGIAEEVRASTSVPLSNSEGDVVTLSIGVALATPDDGVVSLIDRANRGLYFAKRHGKNQVALATDPGT